MVKNYTDNQILDRVKSLKSYNVSRKLPKYLIVGIRSNEDTPDAFDDKIYLYIDGVFQLVANCTTNPGVPILLGGWRKYNSKGAALLKSDEIYYDAFEKSNPKGNPAIPLHNGKMTALIQMLPMLYYRDGNNNNKNEEVGTIYKGNYSTNIHFNNYDLKTKILNTVVGGWSAGCQVLNQVDKYIKLLSLIPIGVKVTYVLLKEFD